MKRTLAVLVMPSDYFQLWISQVGRNLWGFDHGSVYMTLQACCQVMWDTPPTEGKRIFAQALVGLIDRTLKERKGVKPGSLEINLGSACQCLWDNLLARSFGLLFQ